jgi:hypothetical protein
VVRNKDESIVLHNTIQSAPFFSIFSFLFCSSESFRRQLFKVYARVMAQNALVTLSVQRCVRESDQCRWSLIILCLSLFSSPVKHYALSGKDDTRTLANDTAELPDRKRRAA